MDTITEHQHNLIMKYQAERGEIKANIQKSKITYLLETVGVEFAKRIKTKDCMYTRDCFQEFLTVLADTIARSDQDTAYLLPVVQKIKNRVFGC